MTGTKRLALCGLLTALGTVLMLAGGALGIGMYLIPMLVGASLILVGEQFGRRYQLLTWAAISLLSGILVIDTEETLMFVCFFGWYPAARISLQKLPVLLRAAVKFLLFNGIMVVLEYLIVKFLVPETETKLFWLILWIVGNIVFVLYDIAIPRFRAILLKRFSRLLQHF